MTTTEAVQGNLQIFITPVEKTRQKRKEFSTSEMSSKLQPKKLKQCELTPGEENFKVT